MASAASSRHDLVEILPQLFKLPQFHVDRRYYTPSSSTNDPSTCTSPPSARGPVA